MPPPDYSGLSPEELRQMEGHERQAVDARIQVLRNVHTLLDAAVVQLQQYTSVVAAGRSVVLCVLFVNWELHARGS